MIDLNNLIHQYKPQLDALAEVWLEDIACKVALYLQGEPVLEYTGNSKSKVVDVVQIPLGNNRIELRVYLKADSILVRRRIVYQARLISSIISLEEQLEGMTIELIDTQDQMLALYKLGRSVRGQLDLQETLETLTREAHNILKVDNVSLLLRIDVQQIVQYPAQLVPPELLLDALREIQTHGYEVLQPPKNYLNIGIYNGTIIPIIVQGKIVGCMSFVNRREGFNSPELKLSRAVAEEASVQIEKIMLYRQTLEQAKLGTELELAANIQTQLLPQTIPDIEGLDLFATSVQARMVGGDFFDMMYKEGSPLTIAVGDVAGKGMSAALLMAMTRTVLRTWTKTLATNQAGPLLTMVNDDLYDDYTQVSSFTTAFVGRYNPETRVLRYANAGHSPVIYYSRTHGAQLMTAADMPLGVLPDIAFEDAAMTLSPGDILLVATDGLSEARAPDGELFGYERLLQIVDANAHQSAQVMARTLFDAIHLFEQGTPQSDDQTLLVLKIL